MENNSNKLVLAYLNSDKEIASLRSNRDAEIKKLQDMKRTIHYEFEDKINELEKKQREAEQFYEDEEDKIEAETKTKIEEQAQNLNKVFKIIYLLKLKTKFPEFDLAKVHTRKGYGDHKPAEMLDSFEDRGMKLGLYLGFNRNKVNNVELGIFGRCIFGEKTYLDIPHNWTMDIDPDWDNRANVEYSVKTFPTELAAREYAKHKGGIKGIFKEFLQRYRELLNEFEQACNTYTLDEFRPCLIEQAFHSLACHSHTDEFQKQLGITTFERENMTKEEIEKVLEWYKND